MAATLTRFTHGMCPDCIRKYYPEMDAEELGV
jgi:hypothetical protein